MTDYLTVVFPNGISTAFEPAFQEAGAFWNAVITSGAEPSTLEEGLDVSGTQCGVEYTYAPGTVIEGLQIFASTPPIDGPGQILGRAGPCVYHGGLFASPMFPMLGIMEFDSADSADLVESGQFANVVVHEMGHVIGIGTLWPVIPLLDDPCPLFVPRPCDPYYIGENGIEGFNQLNPPSEIGPRPPVANTGGTGTANGHWREATFVNELMTGYLNAESENPLSIMTVLSLKDLNYEVDITTAEDYTVPEVDFSRGIGEDAIRLFGDIVNFDFQFVEDVKERFPARVGVTAQKSYDSEFGALFVVMLLGFVALGGFMSYLQKKQRNEYETLLAGKGVATTSPMHRLA